MCILDNEVNSIQTHLSPRIWLPAPTHRPGEELPKAAFKDSEGQGCAGSGKSASNRYNRYYI